MKITALQLQKLASIRTDLIEAYNSHTDKNQCSINFTTIRDLDNTIEEILTTK